MYVAGCSTDDPDPDGGRGGGSGGVGVASCVRVDDPLAVEESGVAGCDDSEAILPPSFRTSLGGVPVAVVGTFPL